VRTTVSGGEHYAGWAGAFGDLKSTMLRMIFPARACGSTALAGGSAKQVYVGTNASTCMMRKKASLHNVNFYGTLFLGLIFFALPHTL
jgi:hypothetical protein